MSAEKATIPGELDVSVTPGEVGVCVAAMPVLVRQIESARAHSQAAVSTLNGHFAKLLHQLQDMSNLAMALRDGGRDAFDRIDAEFMQMIEAQAAIAQEHAEVARKTSALAPAVASLLAAARGSNTTSVDALEGIATQLFELMDAHTRLAENAQATTMRSEVRADEALAPYGETMSKLAQYGDSMRGDVTECLIQLQFQDRVSQTLEHVTTTLTMLTRYLSGANGPVATEAQRRFLAAMASGYTTEEQHDSHTS